MLVGIIAAWANHIYIFIYNIMANIKIKLRLSSDSTSEGRLYFQIIHNRVSRQVSTDYRLYPCEWDASRSTVIVLSSASAQRQSYLLSVQASLDADIWKIRAVRARLDSCAQPYTADMVVSNFRDMRVRRGVIAYAMELSTCLRESGRRSMAGRLVTTANSFGRYLKGADIPLEDMDTTVIQGYEQWMLDSGLCRNTSSFYLRNLRTVYRHAVDEGLSVCASPFRHVYTGIDKTAKRAISVDKVRQIRRLDLSGSPSLELARDIFMFSFYTRGMSFVDMAHLTVRNLKGGVLTYRRQKTSRQMRIGWKSDMQEIVDKYYTEGSPFLLPIAMGEGRASCQNYKNAYKRISKNLKKIGEMIGLSIPLTTYVARHSWASIAKSKNVAVSTISEALGHDSEKTTQIYLSSLDTSVVDDANDLIIGFL